MFGVHAYVIFTIDRLMQNIVRQVEASLPPPSLLLISILFPSQLQAVVTDEHCFQIMECYSNFVEQLSASHTRAESLVAIWNQLTREKWMDC